LGCLTVPGIITVFLVILVVIGAGMVRGGRLFSPGTLNAQPGALIMGVSSHAELGGTCSACHAYFWQEVHG
jgi:hypothetical protein